MDFQFSVNYENKTDEELMYHITKGKEKAFNEIYDRYSKCLFIFFYQKLQQDQNKAQDFLQDLFLKIIEKAELFDINKKFSSWIYSIAFNMCKNEYRRIALGQVKKIVMNPVDLFMDITDNSTSVDNNYDLAYFRKCFYNELERLDEIHSTTFILRHQDDLSIKSIAEIMDCPEGTVKSRLFYATKKLSYSLRIFSSSKL